MIAYRCKITKKEKNMAKLILKTVLPFALAAAMCGGVQAADRIMDFEDNAQPCIITGVGGAFAERGISDGAYRCSGKTAAAFRILGMLDDSAAADTKNCYNIKARVFVEKLSGGEQTSAPIKLAVTTPGGAVFEERVFDAAAGEWTDIAMQIIPRSADFNTLSFSAVPGDVYADTFKVDDVSVTRRAVLARDTLAKVSNFNGQPDATLAIFTHGPENEANFGNITVSWYNTVNNYLDGDDTTKTGLAAEQVLGDGIGEEKNPGFFIFNMDNNFKYHKYSEEDFGKMITVNFRMSIIGFESPTPVNVSVETITGFNAKIVDDSKMDTIEGLANKRTYTLTGTEEYPQKKHEEISYSYILSEATKNVVGYKITVDSHGLYDEEKGWPAMRWTKTYRGVEYPEIWCGLEPVISIEKTTFAEE